jgi:hypothetical protein
MRQNLPNSLEKLLTLERQVERQWWWLNGALHAVAQMKAEAALGNVTNFREMQAQLRAIDRQRVEIARRIAELEVSQQVDGYGCNCTPAPMAPNQPQEVLEVSWQTQREPLQWE